MDIRRNWWISALTYRSIDGNLVTFVISAQVHRNFNFGPRFVDFLVLWNWPPAIWGRSNRDLVIPDGFDHVPGFEPKIKTIDLGSGLWLCGCTSYTGRTHVPTTVRVAPATWVTHELPHKGNTYMLWLWAFARVIKFSRSNFANFRCNLASEKRLSVPAWYARRATRKKLLSVGHSGRKPGEYVRAINPSMSLLMGLFISMIPLPRVRAPCATLSSRRLLLNIIFKLFLESEELSRHA